MTIRSSSEGRWVGILCGLASALIWGAFPVVTRLGLTHTALDAYDITAIRFTVSGVVLLPILFRNGRKGLSWIAIGLLVGGIGAPYMLVVASGLALAPVEQFAIVTPASMILLSVIISTWLWGSRLPARSIAGIALILVGVALVGYRSFGASHASPRAYLIFLAGGLMWAIYTVASKHFDTAPLHATAVVSVFSMVGYLPFYLFGRGTRILEVPASDIGLQVRYQGIMVSVVALFFYSKSVRLLGASIGATFAALVPGIATLLAAVVLAELPDAVTMTGLLIVTGGMALTLLQKPTPSTSGVTRQKGEAAGEPRVAIASPEDVA